MSEVSGLYTATRTKPHIFPLNGHWYVMSIDPCEPFEASLRDPSFAKAHDWTMDHYEVRWRDNG